jgi:hypothetical protein
LRLARTEALHCSAETQSERKESDQLTDQPPNDSAAQARAMLAAAYKDLLAASKVAVGDDGGTLLGAAAAIDVAVECLTPPNTDTPLAMSSCREALELTSKTRTYAQGGNIANSLDAAKRHVADALKILAA